MEEKILYTNKLVSTGTKQEKFRKDRNAQKMTKITKSLKINEMKKHGDELYDKAILEEESLLDAYNNKRLKSKRLIKEARKTINKRNKEAEAAQNKEEVTE